MKNSEPDDQNKVLALAGGFIAATIVFIALYQVGSYCTHDKPLSFITGLVVSLTCLWNVQETLLHWLISK